MLKTLLKSFILIFTFLIFFVDVNKQIDGTPLNDDGLNNLRLAYSIAHFGTMADKANMDFSELTPSNAREPVPNWITAQWIKNNKNLLEDKTLHITQSPKQLISIKKVNTWILMGVFLGVFSLAYSLFNPIFSKGYTFMTAYAAMLITYACMHTVYVTTMITEFHGALFVTWFSWAWVKTFQSQRWYYATLAGLLLGLLILTKAAFLYISAALMLFLIPWLLIRNKAMIHTFNNLILIVCAAIVVLPWMYRNYVELDTITIAGRGPNVLMTRAFKSQMTDDEFKGAFYAYAPASLKKTMSTITGFNGKDRLLGGRLQRFTRFFPEDLACQAKNLDNCAVGYYVQANMQYNKIINSYLNQYPNDLKKANLLGEKAAKDFAMSLIKNNILGHLKSSLVFAWRGAWPCNKVDGRWYKSDIRIMQPAWQEIMPFMGLIAMFGLAITALIQKKDELIALTWLGCATFLFYALATHFIPRYSEMMIPIWIVCFMYLLIILSKKIACLMRSKIG